MRFGETEELVLNREVESGPTLKGSPGRGRGAPQTIHPEGPRGQLDSQSACPSIPQRPHNSPVGRSYEGISLLQRFQVLGRHTEISCKIKTSDKTAEGLISTQVLGVGSGMLAPESGMHST